MKTMENFFTTIQYPPDVSRDIILRLNFVPAKDYTRLRKKKIDRIKFLKKNPNGEIFFFGTKLPEPYQLMKYEKIVNWSSQRKKNAKQQQ